MTNKTIIDGIDVSKCKSFDKCNGHNICCYLDTREDKIPFANFCIENKGCYFKQLARAKEEIEKWKHQAELGSDTTDRLSKQLEQKEQECETLKSENFTFEELVKTQDDEIEKLKKNLQLSPKFSIENGVAHYTITQEEYEKLKDKEQECEELYNEKMKFIDKSIEQKCKIKELVDENATKEVIYKINGKCAKTVADKVKEIRKIIEGKDCKYSKYKQALDEISAYCSTILADRCHYSVGAVRMADKLMREYINKAKEQ